MEGEQRIIVWPYYVGLTFLILVMSIGIALYHLFWSNHEWIIDTVGAFGVSVSCLGVILALIQIKQAKLQIELAQRKIDSVDAIAKATKTAVDSNKEEIRKLLSFADMAHLEEVVKNAQDNLHSKQYSRVIDLVKNIHRELIRVQSLFPDIPTKVDVNLQELIKNHGVDIHSLSDHIIKTTSRGKENDKGTLKPEIIFDNLELTRVAVIKIEMELRKDKV